MARKSSQPSYLKRRRLGWYVQLAVPVALQPIIGAKVLTRSLKTRDEGEARRRRFAAIADLQNRLNRAAAVAESSHPLMTAAQTLRAAEDAGHATPRDTEAALSMALDEHLAELAKHRGRDSEGRPNLSEDEVAAIRRAHDIAAGRPDESLGGLVARHLEQLEADSVLRPSTLQAKRQHLEEFLAWFGRRRSWREVRRRDALAFMRRLSETPRGRSAKGPALSRTSVVKRLSDVRVFFRWVLDHEDADTRPANPFDGVQPTRSVRGKQTARRPWTEEELSTLLHGVPPDDPLWSLGAIGAYSGARLEEIASLRVEAVEGESFVVTEGKRQASVRRVPIHPVVAPLFARLVKSSPDGYLIPHLLPSGYDGKRGGLASKRFGNTIRRLGITDPRVVFHSLRNTVETQLLAKGVPLERAQMIVGHASLGASVPYIDRGSVQDRENRAALSLISYGQELDDFVKKTGPTVTVQQMSQPRKRRT